VVFSRLREWRKGVSEKEGAPVYTIFTNEQLAQMVQKEVRSKAALKEIEGVGEARVEKYGEAIGFAGPSPSAFSPLDRTGRKT
jgi:superfamily II DNA helicase RecQ